MSLYLQHLEVEGLLDHPDVPERVWTSSPRKLEALLGLLQVW